MVVHVMVLLYVRILIQGTSFPSQSQSPYDLSFPFQEAQREMPHGSGMLGAVS